MSRYAQVDRSMWGDEKFRSLSGPKPNAQTLFIWLLTSPDASFIPGAYRVGPAGISEALRWPLPSTKKFLAELEAAGMIRADQKALLLWLPNALKRNEPRSADNLKPWAKAWQELPECALKAEIWEAMYAYFQGRGGEFPPRFETLCPHPYVDPKGGPKGGPKGTPEPHPKGGPMGAGAKTDASTHSPDPNNNSLNPDPEPDPDPEQEQKQEVVVTPAPAADGCRLETTSAPPVRIPADPLARVVLAHLLTHPVLAPIATPGYAEIIAGAAHASAKTQALTLQAIDELALDAKAGAEDNQFVSPKELGKQASRFVANVRPRRPPPPVPGQTLTPDQVLTEQRRRGVQQGTGGPPRAVRREGVPDER